MDRHSECRSRVAKLQFLGLCIHGFFPAEPNALVPNPLQLFRLGRQGAEQRRAFSESSPSSLPIPRPKPCSLAKRSKASPNTSHAVTGDGSSARLEAPGTSGGREHRRTGRWPQDALALSRPRCRVQERERPSAELCRSGAIPPSENCR